MQRSPNRMITKNKKSRQIVHPIYRALQTFNAHTQSRAVKSGKKRGEEIGAKKRELYEMRMSCTDSSNLSVTEKKAGDVVRLISKVHTNSSLKCSRDR